MLLRAVTSRGGGGGGGVAGAAAYACEELPRGVALDQWDFFGVPRRGDHGNETGYGEAFYILTLWDKLVKAGMRPTRSAVNLGANDGISGDPTFELFERGWSGLAVEPSKKSGLVGFIERPLWERLWENLPWDRVVKDDTPVTPDNVVALFDRAKLPLDLDVLKIDLDSYDIFVVERVLLHSRYRPKIIVMEISEGARKREGTRETDAGRVRASRSLSHSLSLSLSLSRARARAQTRRSRRRSCSRRTTGATGTGPATTSSPPRPP
jgi:hypothetical protein